MNAKEASKAKMEVKNEFNECSQPKEDSPPTKVAAIKKDKVLYYKCSSNVLYVCLIRTSDSSDPFISAIELRSLSGSLYEAQVKPGLMLSSISRYDLGAQSSDLIRYPQDRFDRLWFSDRLWSSLYNNTLIREAHSNKIVLNKNDITGFPPGIVMQTCNCQNNH
ncbi:probable LRR receptor-like serine/threonine-protein kinase At2g28960 [Cryptomeria japonica]|uniref:probable LRR receptor-like serine/threonine-protein kinase At2g28960 n=1 Tax=Cryptomeria japonica TaxID=3369 RepID=UPI0027DA8795|nr:probable LRR receptor-like serine/threonine-protein kinase At2g28960 [Cryptomeria japonica]